MTRTVRFVGGPKDGEVIEIETHQSEFLFILPDENKRSSKSGKWIRGGVGHHYTWPQDSDAATYTGLMGDAFRRIGHPLPGGRKRKRKTKRH